MARKVDKFDALDDELGCCEQEVGLPKFFGHGPLVVKNTFLDPPVIRSESLEEFVKARQVFSCPATRNPTMDTPRQLASHHSLATVEEFDRVHPLPGLREDDGPSGSAASPGHNHMSWLQSVGGDLVGALVGGGWPAPRDATDDSFFDTDPFLSGQPFNEGNGLRSNTDPSSVAPPVVDVPVQYDGPRCNTNPCSGSPTAMDTPVLYDGLGGSTNPYLVAPAAPMLSSEPFTSGPSQPRAPVFPEQAIGPAFWVNDQNSVGDWRMPSFANAPSFANDNLTAPHNRWVPLPPPCPPSLPPPQHHPELSAFRCPPPQREQPAFAPIELNLESFLSDLQPQEEPTTETPQDVFDLNAHGPSALHGTGECKPCMFVHATGCRQGLDCQFCHRCPPGEQKRRRWQKLHEQKRKRRAEQRAKRLLLGDKPRGDGTETAEAAEELDEGDDDCEEDDMVVE